MVYQSIHSCLDWLLPQSCLLCKKPVTQSLALCASCLEQLPVNDHACRRCALPLPDTAPPDAVCGQCQRQPPPFDSIFAPWLYAEPLNHLILQLKRARKLAAGRLLGQLLADQVPSHDLPELILPIPSHPKKLKKNGFNHSGEIARSLSQELNLPWAAHLLKKTKDTPGQHGLTRRQRQANLRRCFALSETPKARSVVLLDDVVTTGATVREAALTLKQAEIKEVRVWALARTPRR